MRVDTVENLEMHPFPNGTDHWAELACPRLADTSSFGSVAPRHGTRQATRQAMLGEDENLSSLPSSIAIHCHPLPSVAVRCRPSITSGTEPSSIEGVGWIFTFFSFSFVLEPVRAVVFGLDGVALTSVWR